MQSSIWFERYKPTSLQDLIIPEEMRTRLSEYVGAQSLPNLGLWSVQPGLGKSSTANVIVNELGCEALWINASMEKGIDVIRSKINTFASQASFDGKIKVVVMDECDALTADAQASFRAFLDEKSKNCRFIFTGNYKNKLIEPLLDRLENHDYGAFKLSDVAQQLIKHCVKILQSEGVEYDIHDIATVIKAKYPCIRSIIGELQRMSNTGKLIVDAFDDLGEDLFNLLKDKNFDKIYRFVLEMSSPDNIFSYLFKNINDIFSSQSDLTKANIILVIAKYQDMSSRVRDKYINTAACLIEISNILKV